MSTTTIPAWVALNETAGDGNLKFQDVESKKWDDDNIDGVPSYKTRANISKDHVLQHVRN
jgi:hypothetical protein